MSNPADGAVRAGELPATEDQLALFIWEVQSLPDAERKAKLLWPRLAATPSTEGAGMREALEERELEIARIIDRGAFTMSGTALQCETARAKARRILSLPAKQTPLADEKHTC